MRKRKFNEEENELWRQLNHLDDPQIKYALRFMRRAREIWKDHPEGFLVRVGESKQVHQALDNLATLEIVRVLQGPFVTHGVVYLPENVGAVLEHLQKFKKPATGVTLTDDYWLGMLKFEKLPFARRYECGQIYALLNNPGDQYEVPHLRRHQAVEDLIECNAVDCHLTDCKRILTKRSHLREPELAK